MRYGQSKPGVAPCVEAEKILEVFSILRRKRESPMMTALFPAIRCSRTRNQSAWNDAGSNPAGASKSGAICENAAHLRRIIDNGKSRLKRQNPCTIAILNVKSATSKSRSFQRLILVTSREKFLRGSSTCCFSIWRDLNHWPLHIFTVSP